MQVVPATEISAASFEEAPPYQCTCLQAGELRKAGLKLKLTGKPFQVLAIRLERPGEAVTPEQLQKRLWPDTFVDVDHNLNTAINKTREALGDSAENPRFVETLPRRGYRFTAPIEKLDVNKTRSASVPVSENATPPEPVSQPVGPQPETTASERTPTFEKHRRWFLMLTALAVVALAAGILWRGKRGLQHRRCSFCPLIYSRRPTTRSRSGDPLLCSSVLLGFSANHRRVYEAETRP